MDLDPDNNPVHLAVIRVCEKRGKPPSLAEFARFLGVSRAAVTQYGEFLPEHRARQVAAYTGLSLTELMPDIDWTGVETTRPMKRRRMEAAE